MARLTGFSYKNTYGRFATTMIMNDCNVGDCIKKVTIKQGSTVMINISYLELQQLQNFLLNRIKINIPSCMSCFMLSNPPLLSHKEAA